MASKTTIEKEAAILNGIAEEAGLSDSLPFVTSEDDVCDFGRVLNDNFDYRNKFINIFFRIAYRAISNVAWENPLNFIFKRTEFGVGVEEVFEALSKPIAYDAFGEGEVVWKRVMPDVRSVLHLINVKTMIKKTIYAHEMKTAFNSYNEWVSFHESLLRRMYDSLQDALYQACVYIIALYMVEVGTVYKSIPDFETNPKAATKALYYLSNKMRFNSSKFNPFGVRTSAPKNNQYLFVTPEFDASQNVEVYAYMFNIERGETGTRVIMIDSFADHNYDLLNNMFTGGVPKVFSQEEVNTLKKIPAFLCDKELLMFYDVDTEASTIYNNEKRYWNNFLHYTGILSYSPFRNAVALYTGEEAAPVKIFNPYGETTITVGRDNMFYVMPAMTTGGMSPKQQATYEVAGAALSPIPEKPGWYQVSNKAGDTATITYSYGELEPLTITMKVI